MKASHSLEETQKIAADWLVMTAKRRAAQEGGSDEALVVGLYGHLGAGKTAFVKAVARKFGIIEEVTSPTFVIMKMYEIPIEKENEDTTSWPWKRLIHIDAYRLEHREELDALNWEQIVSDPRNLILIEWPENAELTPENGPIHERIQCEIKNGTHTIEVVQ